MVKNTSKLGLGPSNPQHKTFLENEQKIHRTLHRALRDRRINLTAREIYQAAGITSPTFYLHCRNSNDALRRYERKLERNLYGLIPEHAKKDSVLTIFALYIVKNQPYFVAALNGSDYYLIEKIITHYRYVLAGTKSDDVKFVIYTCTLTSILSYWGKIERFSERTMPKYVDQMLKVE